MDKSIRELLKPWMVKPFEFIFHAESHYKSGSDYGKRMAYISFDNAIEISINTFIHINLKPKGLKLYGQKDLDSAKTYFGKLEIFEKYVQSKHLPVLQDKDIISHLHDQRNYLYHEAILSSPDISELNDIRKIALWIFSTLFDLVNIYDILNTRITEAELECPQIPEEYVKPIITGLDQQQKGTLFIAYILGSWDENSQGDNYIISKITQTDSNKWLNDIREIKNNNSELFILKNGHWQTKEKFDNLSRCSSLFYDTHLDLIKDILLEVLSGIHPQFDLKPEDRFAWAVYGKAPKYSSELRKGILETFVFLGIHGKELKNCTLHKSEDIVWSTMREIFKNSSWKLWASLNDILPILAETEPVEFLSSVENALKQSPCPFDELFSQEGVGGIITGANHMTGLYWALEILAWSEEYLPRSVLALAELATHDPGGNWSNRPINSIITILIPWLSQTVASFDKKISSLKGIQRNHPDIAWRVLIKLLPTHKGSTMGGCKPKYRNYIPTDWKQEVTNAEYWKQVEEYVSMAVDMAKNNIIRTSELVENIDNIPQPFFNVFLEYLSSDVIVKLPDEQKLPIWEKLSAFVRKHSAFSNAKWALPKEKIELLEKAAEKISPSDPQYLYRYLFTNKDLHFMYKKENYQVREEKLRNLRIDALKKIYKDKKINTIIIFSEKIESPAILGDTFAYIADKENDIELLPSFLEKQDEHKKQFIKGYILNRYYNNKINWIESLNTNIWSNEQKCEFLCFLPFENEIWEKAKEFLGKNIAEYWRKIDFNQFPVSQSSLLPAVENLLKYNRPCFAFSCAYSHYFSTKEIFKEQAIKALIDSITSEESQLIDPYHLTEIIKILQEDSSVNEKDLFKIEWGYLQLLDNYDGTTPKLLEKYLSQKPEFFVEIIQTTYCSKNDDKDKKKLSEHTKNLANNAWRLLQKWKRPPGKMDDGSFSIEALKKWIDYVKIKTIESGHFEIAMNRLGHVLFYVDTDSSGLWIQKSVAEILDEKDNENILQSFISEIYTSRGVYTVDPSGKPEKELANYWRKKAEDIENLGLIRFATSLKEIAASYDRQSERTIFDNSTEMEA
jgi:hypothetical protein